MKRPPLGRVLPFASVLLAMKATTLPVLSDATVSSMSPEAMLGSKVFARGLPMVSVEKQRLAFFAAVMVPVTLKEESVLKGPETLAAGPPFELSNEPREVPVTAG